ncbi:hypothetical protein PR202_gb29847 [Eleusine coracana subsp. coracana]|uniref:Protein kinase domain-containing protein n=1 Tax=Eleusine coracana subsp. coracana TaxID=191504 RepID=A0AAV5FY18_ELECO|nr:hypothetical protein PR202_gb29847 [Eleusine coracana subsp. coracana]
MVSSFAQLTFLHNSQQKNPAAQFSQRRLLQDSNLAAPSSGNGPAPAAVPVPSTGSGSFSAFSPNNAPEPAIAPPPVPSMSPATPTEAPEGKSFKLFYVIVLPLIVLLLISIVCMVMLCRNKSGKTIGPWKTGLSGQLQKAFVTGNDIIDSLSRINHKNFINLLGYCEEEEPFMRMMVLEYAPNGTLYEHLHVEGFDPIDWNGRMRVIMGVAYCIQHMHELSPPIAHPGLKSSAILLSEDGAAKIADMSVWQEVYSKGNMPKNDEFVDHHEPVAADPAGNVCSFGLLMLEIISGKPSYSEDKVSLTNLALECIKDGRSMSCLLDPTLKAHKEKD